MEIFNYRQHGEIDLHHKTMYAKSESSSIIVLKRTFLDLSSDFN